MMFTSQPRHRQRGFTLIELMVAMVVSAIVVLGVFAFSSIQAHTGDLHERNVRVQQALEGAMWSIGQDVQRAGLGWTRICTELRVYDSGTGQLINPSGTGSPSTAVRDALTNEAYWVLRDGIQGHWNSSAAASLEGSETVSSSLTSAADALDVVVSDSVYVESTGIFSLQAVDTGLGVLDVQTGPSLDPGNADHLAEVQQLFPPGSFVVLVPGLGANPLEPVNQSQCVLVQVTGDVAGAGSSWNIPVGAISGFNQNLNALLSDPAGDVGPCPQDETGAFAGSYSPELAEDIDCDDWSDATGGFTGNAWAVPVGRLRWSRYEIDYSIPTIPYLVRYDIIGYQPGVDPTGLGGMDYPSCTAGSCTAAQLHLPGSNSPPTAVAIGPMVEDMQVAVGCDGWTGQGVFESRELGDTDIPVPDAGFVEVGPAEGVTQPNRVIDENSFASGLRASDEWLGNAQNEQWAPDCVHYGTAEYNRTDWQTVEGTSNPPPAHRMSPQSVRVTLTASAEFAEEAGGVASDTLSPVEDRPSMASPVGRRTRFSLTERFSPANLRWRNPNVL